MVAGRDEPRPCPSMAALIERPVPVRVRVGTSENVTDRWLGERVAEFEARLQPLTLRRCEEVVVVHGTPTGESNPAATSAAGGKDRLWGSLRCQVATAIRPTSAIVNEGWPWSKRCSHAALADQSQHRSGPPEVLRRSAVCGGGVGRGPVF